MGMFSWKCKGCGLELHEGELVRMNGCKGEYDGYGRAGGYDYAGCNGRDEPRCWHEACYQEATPEQKLDESPSEYGNNQGFGYSLEKYMPNPEYTKFYEIRAIGPSDDPKRLCARYIFNNFDDLVQLGELDGMMDQRDEWNAANMHRFPILVKASELADKNWPEAKPIYDSEEYQKAWAELQSQSPFQPKMFDDLEECRRQARELADKLGSKLDEIIILAATERRGFNGAVEAVKGELT